MRLVVQPYNVIIIYYCSRVKVGQLFCIRFVIVYIIIILYSIVDRRPC